jgi:hypothetical protein
MTKPTSTALLAAMARLSTYATTPGDHLTPLIKAYGLDKAYAAGVAALKADILALIVAIDPTSAKNPRQGGSERR